MQTRVPGEPFVAKPAKDAEMEKILRSMEVLILLVLSILYVQLDILCSGNLRVCPEHPA